jgi:hypothetical protein
VLEPRALSGIMCQTAEPRGTAATMASPILAAEIQLAELLAALALATDLAKNLPLESTLRNALLAVGIASRHGISGDALSDVYYLAILHHLGCTSHRESRRWPHPVVDPRRLPQTPPHRGTLTS